jgi:S-DNA-T family DNA segregation ATPase FtsK/SpoIIIE
VGSVLNEPVVNKAGVFGAYLSDISFAIFGYVSYLIPIAIVWLGYNFHRDANKERQSQLTFLLRLISFFVMLFFIAALAHQYAPNIELMDNIKVAFLLGGWVGESMHEHLFYGVFGDSSTLIYVGIILVSFSVATSASWKNISYLTVQKSSQKKRKDSRQAKERKNKARNH